MLSAMIEEGVREGVSKGVAAGLVLGFAKLDVLTPDAQAFLNRDSFAAYTPQEEGIREALIELGYLERRWWQIRYRRTDKPLPNGRDIRQILSKAVTTALAEKGGPRKLSGQVGEDHLPNGRTGQKVHSNLKLSLDRARSGSLAALP